MDNSIIEQKGVNAVKDYLLGTEVIVPHIVDGNTLPMWDGEIFVYRSKDISNANFAFRLPVQVKAHKINNKFSKTVSQQIPIVHLEKYYNDGGVVFFSVYFKNNRKVIYCAFLGRSELKRFLNAGNGEQTYKSVPLAKAPKDKKELLKKLKSVDMQRKYELIDLSTLNGRTDFQIKFNVEIPKGGNIFEYLATHYIDVTIAIDGVPGLFYPEGGPVSLQVATDIDCDISIEDVTYYHSFHRSFKSDGMHIKVGKSIELVFPHEYTSGKHFNINITLKADTLSEVITELSFINALKRFKYIQFGNSKLLLSKIESDKQEFINWENALGFWRKVERLMTILHIVEPLELNNFNEDDEKQLKALIQGYLDNDVVYCSQHDQDFLSIVNICNLKIFVYGKHIEGDKFKLLNVYEHCVSGFTDDDGNHHLTPVISYMLNLERVPSNLLLSSIVDEYKVMEKRDSTVVIRANLDALYILNLYDKTNDVKFLDAAYDIVCWLKNEKIDYIGKNIILINYLQILYRRNKELTTDEKEILYNLDDMDVQENFASSVLLGEKGRALRFYEQLSTEEKEAINRFPIYTLFKKLVA